MFQINVLWFCGHWEINKAYLSLKRMAQAQSFDEIGWLEGKNCSSRKEAFPLICDLNIVHESKWEPSMLK